MNDKKSHPYRRNFSDAIEGQKHKRKYYSKGKNGRFIVNDKHIVEKEEKNNTD